MKNAYSDTPIDYVRPQGRIQEFWKGGGSDMNNQQGEGVGGGCAPSRASTEAFGGPAFVHWMICYVTWGVLIALINSIDT